MVFNDGLDMIIEDVAIAQPWHEKSLVEKVISYECDVVNVEDFEEAMRFWQELIDRGICWHPEMPAHYERQAVQLIEAGTCKPSPDWITPPHTPGPFGHDRWDRPPSHEDWGRPLRWKQMRRERLRIYKEAKRILDETGKLPEIKVDCCKGDKK